MNTIYNTYVVMESQEQCDRMKQLCIDNGLEISDNYYAFDFFGNNNQFYCYNITERFSVLFDAEKDDFTQITEQEFIKLLKTTKLCKQ